ncbi:glutaminyl-tRNA synthetase [Klebsiella pneumoniae]|uniref:50S ribosomal protein L25 n=1 Tax=Klebsiella pneumoniae TaxID=573 RepID=A0A3S5DI19_KLEPN|nr:glutaminyl-tRNA synthetase [Klebsiella pneumoniae]
MAVVKCRSAPNLDRSRGLPRRANKQYKRLVLGKEVRLRNAYVIKAERVEKDAEGNITTIFCTYDATP